MEFLNIDEYINDYNNSPQEKLFGLSPYQTYETIHNPLVWFVNGCCRHRCTKLGNARRQ